MAEPVRDLLTLAVEGVGEVVGFFGFPGVNGPLRHVDEVDVSWSGGTLGTTCHRPYVRGSVTLSMGRDL